MNAEAPTVTTNTLTDRPTGCSIKVLVWVRSLSLFLRETQIAEPMSMTIHFCIRSCIQPRLKLKSCCHTHERILHIVFKRIPLFIVMISRRTIVEYLIYVGLSISNIFFSPADFPTQHPLKQVGMQGVFYRNIPFEVGQVPTTAAAASQPLSPLSHTGAAPSKVSRFKLLFTFSSNVTMDKKENASKPNTHELGLIVYYSVLSLRGQNQWTGWNFEQWWQRRRLDRSLFSFPLIYCQPRDGFAK